MSYPTRAEGLVNRITTWTRDEGLVNISTHFVQQSFFKLWCSCFFFRPATLYGGWTHPKLVWLPLVCLSLLFSLEYIRPLLLEKKPQTSCIDLSKTKVLWKLILLPIDLWPHLHRRLLCWTFKKLTFSYLSRNPSLSILTPIKICQSLQLF